ncbi:hypothetical protein SDC9_130593 [bioreactor metagenome]|uniref:Uncharacterized protein n=1 Tax=bioreactor metagenome TaxID=1076179 RepID=A0A645D2U5_9ZZZZ
MYAFVDVQDYQKVMVTDASLGIEAAANAYLQMMGTADYDETQVMTGTFVIGSINSVIIDGNTYYYLQSVNGEKYSVVASLNLAVTPYLLPGDTISCSYYLNETGINTIVKIEKMAEEVPAETAVTEGEGA